MSTDDQPAPDAPAPDSTHDKDRRINIPLNLSNWKSLPDDIRLTLLWFHQFIIDHKYGWKEASAAIDYDNSVVFRVLRGEYEGSYINVCSAIRKFRKREETPLTLKKHLFVKNPISQLVFNGLSYALNNQSVCLIVGESGQGKSVAAQAWKQENNHGKTVMVIAPAYGGTKALLHEIGRAVGANVNLNCYKLHEAILDAFDESRILVVDEAHRLLPSADSTKAVSLEILRDIHDRKGSGLALIATDRFRTELKKGRYMFEQLIGRVGRPIRLPAKITAEDVDPIVRQFAPRPTEALLTLCADLAEKPGRLRIMVETLRVAAKIAAKKNVKLDDTHVLLAKKIREEMQGDWDL
jgi:DNA transposition AAA+ family ATPase